MSRAVRQNTTMKNPSKIGGQRALILHYHLFKNAGTSVDEMLRRNFGSLWAQHEFSDTRGTRSNTDAVARYLRQRPELLAFSSHTALLPLPAVDGAAVFPILFIRHPIDRLHSAYLFERWQQADTMGARLAKERDFAGYLRELLKPQRRRQARNFQTFRLSMNEPPSAGTDLERALRALNILPFIGLVEAYEQSIQLLGSLLKPFFPNFREVSVATNVTRRPGTTLKERLAAIREELGKELFDEVRLANADDMQIYRVVRKRYRMASKVNEVLT